MMSFDDVCFGDDDFSDAGLDDDHLDGPGVVDPDDFGDDDSDIWEDEDDDTTLGDDYDDYDCTCAGCARDRGEEPTVDTEPPTKEMEIGQFTGLTPDPDETVKVVYNSATGMSTVTSLRTGAILETAQLAQYFTPQLVSAVALEPIEKGQLVTDKQVMMPPPPPPGSTENQGGMKFDAGKPRMSLLPFDALLMVAMVLTFGAKKYAAHSWRTVPNALERYSDALLRHWERMQAGEWLDPESGLPHWAHIACNALFCCALACAERAKNTSELVASKS